MFVVESWNIAVNLDGILLFELSAQFSYASLYFINFYRREHKVLFASLL